MKPTQTVVSLLAGFALVLGMVGAFAAPVFVPSAQPTGWIGRPTVTNPDVSSNNEVYFRGGYLMTIWRGDVQAHPLTDLGEVLEQTPDSWAEKGAAAHLATQHWDTGRKIVTRSGATNVPFRWTNLSSAQQTSIDPSGSAATRQAILNYVRGNRGEEAPNGLKLRARDLLFGALGDIIHATPHYWKHNGGDERLYVGANDGMLHVFDAKTGEEVYAYVPSMLIPRLRELTKTPYVHTAFVDGQLRIARVALSGGDRTILVGGLGAGGRGLYALDVTDPLAADEAAAASKILWEITPATAGFANLGYTYGMPRIARLNNGTAAAIVGNGYVNGGNGRSSLFVINLATGARIAEIDTGSGSTSSPGGLSTPTLLDANGDGKADYAYAGDIDGKLWKFDLTGSTASLLYTTSPAQAITVAPVVRPHPKGGYLVVFGTGRILTAADAADSAKHYVYGIWDKDGTTVADSALLVQTLTPATYSHLDEPTLYVRTITAHPPNWTSHRGWKVELPPGERVVGEAPFHSLNRYYFVSTNPTVSASIPGGPTGENWLNEFDFFSGGAPPGPIFDFNRDNKFDDADCVDENCEVGGIPVSKFMSKGVLSQPVLVFGKGFTSTVYNSHDNVPPSTVGTVKEEDRVGRGVSAGHFDFDNYYFSTQSVTYTNTGSCQSRSLCGIEKHVKEDLGRLSVDYCSAANGFSSGYGLLSTVTKGNKCSPDIKDHLVLTLTCCTYTETYTIGPTSYRNPKHVHEYDDKYDVTGVNMLNASLADFNLNYSIISTSEKFKVMVMNQYLNPAALLSVGGKPYENVKTYGGLAGPYDESKTLAQNAQILLDGLPAYNRDSTTGNSNFIKSLIFNLPLDAFASRNWWGVDGDTRAGLMPTQTGCVNKVNSTGANETSNLGPNGERFNGALTIQIIRENTPASALELNHTKTNVSVSERVKYGWRVKPTEFGSWVLAEYTAFWHHPNGRCYGQGGWVKDPPEDPKAGGSSTPAAGSADPRDGKFTGGVGDSSISNTTVTGAGVTTTATTITYANGQTYTRTVKTFADGTRETTETLPDGTESTSTDRAAVEGTLGRPLGPRPPPFDQTNSAPYEQVYTPEPGRREAWRELAQ